jgi:hypothetical protein
LNPNVQPLPGTSLARSSTQNVTQRRRFAMDETDQDIDIAGTEADPEFTPHAHQPGDRTPVTDADAALPELAPTPRGSEPSTLHRAEDDEAARSRSPEFHDLPGSGKNKTT